MRWLRTTCCCSVALLAFSGSAARAADAALDPQIAQGIQEVNDGDYDAAILRLDRAVRRLASNPDKMKDVAQGYLYLGIAYVGKGHEAAARAKFREAVAQMRDLSLNPEQFPPKVIDLFEAAKEEARKTSPPPAAKPTEPSPPQQAMAGETSKKGGSKKWLLIGGGAAGVLVVAAAAGKKKDDETPQAPVSEPWNGTLTPDNHYIPKRFGPAAAGAWQARFNWATEPEENPDIQLHFAVFDSSGFLLDSRRTGDRTIEAQWDGGQDSEFEIHMETTGPPRFPVHFEGTVTHPAR